MIKKPRGTEDILPSDSPLWRKIEQTAHEVCKKYGFKEIRTLFLRIQPFSDAASVTQQM